jgi:GAF domain-containing protein
MDDELTRSLTELSRLLLKEESVESTLTRVAVLASHLLQGADAASITVADESGLPSTASSTQDLVANLDAEQYRLEEGPCLAALRTRQVYQIDSMAEEKRWSRFVPLAREAGIASLMAIPLMVDGTVGAINFYARQPHVFTEIDRSVAVLFAGQAAVATSNALTFANVQAARAKMAQRLQDALKSRATIDQAVGVLVGREHITPDQAFDMLRSASQRLNIKLRDIAREVMDTSKGSPTP